MKEGREGQKLAFAASVANRIAGGAVGVLLVPIYLKHLSAQEYGVWIMILAVTGYLSLANFGISQTVGNYVAAKWNNPAEYAHLNELLSSAWAVYNGIAVAVLAALGLLATLYFLNIREAHIAFWPLLIAAAGFILALPWQIFSVSLRSSGWIAEEQGLAAGSAIFKYAAVAGALAGGYKLVALAVINTLTLAAPRVLARLCLARRLPWFQVSYQRSSKGAAKQLLNPSAAFFVIQVAGLLAFSTDSLVIGLFLAPEAVVHYGVPMQFAMLGLGIVTLISNVSFPKITNLHASSDLMALRRFVFAQASLQYLLGSAAVVAGCIFGQWLIGFAAAPELVPRGWLFAGFAAFAAAQIIIAPLDAVVMATSSHRSFTYVALAEGLINLILSVVFVNEYGIPGVLIATVLARLFSLIALAAIVTRVLGCSSREIAWVILIFFGLPSVAALSTRFTFQLDIFRLSAGGASAFVPAVILLAVISVLSPLRNRTLRSLERSIEGS